MHILSKSTYIKGLQCPKALYLYKKRPFLRDKLSIEQRARFKRGTDVGILAHEYYPNGVNMAPSYPGQFPAKVQETMENIQNPAIEVMYEAVFQYNDTLIMLDILVRDGDKWKAIEVKSSLSLSETYYNDAALQYYVLNGAGIPLSDFQLMYINDAYVKNGPINPKELFKTQSVLDLVKEKQSFVAKNVDRLKLVLTEPHSPEVRIGTQCHNPYNCDFLGHCWKQVPQNSFLYLTALPDKQLFANYFGDNNTNAKLLRAVDPNSIEAHQLEALDSNSYYFNFKTLFSLAVTPRPQSIGFLNILFYRPAVPVIDGTKPYQELILAFTVKGKVKGQDYDFSWNCFDNVQRWHDSIDILIQQIALFDMIVCFTPQNLTTSLLRHEIIQNKEVGHRIFNLFNVLQQADFYHQKIKAGYTLQNVAEAIFPDVKLFEHSRILQYALSNSELDWSMAQNDLNTENEIVEKLYFKFFK